MLEFVVATLLGALAGSAGAWLFGLRRTRPADADLAATEAAKEAAKEAAANASLLLRLQAQREEMLAWREALRAQAPQLTPLAAEGRTAIAGADSSDKAVQDVLALGRQVAGHVQSLAESVSQTSLAIDEMTFGSLEVAKNIEELSRTCEETAAGMVEMDVSIGEVEANANATSRISAQVNLDAETGSSALHQTMAGIHRIRDGNRTATAVIESLDQKIFAVGKILSVIDDVAEQTNLLALNAAIIAAQAGEHGRGFAVVADEIKALAERTGASTKEIAELILTMQEQSRRATESMAQGLANVDDGVALGNNAGEALLKIVDSAKRSTGMTELIAQATVQQSLRSKQVTDAISRIAETVQQIAYATAEQAKGAQHLNQSTGKMREVVEQVQSSVDTQGRASENVSVYLQQVPGVITRFQEAVVDCQQTQGVLAVQVGAALEALGKDVAATAPASPTK